MRWWGWGEAAHPAMLDAGALAMLAERLGDCGLAMPPVALEHVKLPEPQLASADIAALERVLGADGVSTAHADRVHHAAGRGYLDLVRLRQGEPVGAPDAVARVQSHEQILELLSVCSKQGIAVVPFGGGTSVVGGVEPLRGEHHAVIALELASLSGVHDLDRESMSVTADAGMRVAELERELSATGLTLGHFPQSFEYVSLGGCAATRSAGQASTGYGRFEDLVLGLRAATPAGAIDLRVLPASAAGPDLRQLILGSEGTLGVIDRLSLRVRPHPPMSLYQGLLFGDFQSGAQALRRLVQEGAAPTLARLSDLSETELTLRLASGGIKHALRKLYFAARGRQEGCLAILGFEGDPEQVHLAWRHARIRAREHGAIVLGQGAGEAWRASRFSAPYMRDELLTHGVMVETLETATTWSNLHTLKAAVSAAIEQALGSCGTRGIVGCHISHLYETGASLYFTFIARMLRDEQERQWRAVKDAVGAAIVAGGGTITHHHAIGRDHSAWLRQEIGESGIAALAAVKQELDPAGVMNPGKLLPTS